MTNICIQAGRLIRLLVTCPTWVVSRRRTNLRLSIQRECVGGVFGAGGAAGAPSLPLTSSPLLFAEVRAGAAGVRRRRSSTGTPASCSRTGN